MYRQLRRLAGLAGGALALSLLTAPVAAQGGPKRYAVTHDRALAVTRDVLIQQGFVVVRVKAVGPTQVVYYRRGNQGKGKGKGKLEKLVIRRDADQILFVDTPSAILVAIDLRLRL
jgi:protein-disulfide isomerase